MPWMLLLRLAPVAMQVIQLLEMLVQNVSDKLEMQKAGQDTSKEDEAITGSAKKLASTAVSFLPHSVQQAATPDEIQALVSKLEPVAFGVVDVVHAVVPLLK